MIGSKGFTLIELLLSVTIIGIIMTLTTPVYQSFLTRNDLSNNTEAVASSLRRAVTYARGVKEDSVWGVKVLGSSIVVFKGTTYASRDTTFDETTSFPNTLTASGMDEITFSKLSGVPSTTGTITMTANTTDTRTVTLNAKGMVAY
jgi:prepilin-type N-terminal cleavage/methylation domain-containing protein